MHLKSVKIKVLKVLNIFSLYLKSIKIKVLQVLKNALLRLKFCKNQSIKSTERELSCLNQLKLWLLTFENFLFLANMFHLVKIGYKDFTTRA